MTTSVATDLRDGFDRISEVLTGHELQLLARARDCLHATPKERNQLLAWIVLAYQCGPRQLWSPVLLDLLAPAIVDCLQGVGLEKPLADLEDIRQQFLMELLRAASQMPIHPEGRQMRIRLLTRANKAVVRWLRREGKRQHWQVSLEEWEEANGHDCD